MKISVNFAVIVTADNLQTLFIAINTTTTSLIKQVNIRYKYANEFVKDGVKKIIFVKSAENDSYILTKY